LAATLVASPTAISAAPGPPVIKAITASESPSRHRTVHTLDGRLETGWSVHGDGQWICYELDRVCRVRKVAIAWAAGEQRQYRFEVVVSSDGERWRQAYTGVSGGKTKALETHHFSPVAARFVKIVGHGSNKNQWVNIMEAEIGSAEYVPPPTPEMTRFDPPEGLPADAPPSIYAVTARPSPRPTVPQNTIDGDPRTGWAAQEDGQWLTYHLSRSAQIDSVQVAWDCAHRVRFDVRVSDDGRRWSGVYGGASRGERGELERHGFDPVHARYVRLTVHGSTREHWHRLREVRVGDLSYAPTAPVQWWARRWESGPPSDEYVAAFEPAAKASYGAMAAACVQTLIEKGTDRYGKVQAPIWVLNLDLETMDCFPRYNDALIERAARSLTYSMTAPYGVGYRAIRGSQRESGCSNLYVDQPMIRAAVLMDRLNGNGRFTPAVTAYVRWYFDHLMNERTGLMDWGVHNSYDVFEERLQCGDGYQHELLCILPMWPVLYEVDPEATLAYLAKYWYWHTDPETGIVDRHATRGRGLDFAAAAGELVLVCSYLHTEEPGGPWLDRARQIAQSHWNSRNRDTGLFVNTPHGGTGRRFDNTYSDTTVTGFWASRVLLAGRLTGCDELTEMARGILRAWAKHGWDEEANKPWASLRPNGVPNIKARDYAGTSYGKFDPSGHWDFWKDYVYGFECPFGTLLTYATAAQWTGDEQLKAHAIRLAECYRKLLPANGQHGTFAGNYGQLISFFLVMADLTGDLSYRETARQVADEAVHHLWTGSILRGFAGRTHYTAIEGAGYLVQALAELDADPKRLAELRKESPFLWNL